MHSQTTPAFGFTYLAYIENLKKNLNSNRILLESLKAADFCRSRFAELDVRKMS